MCWWDPLVLTKSFHLLRWVVLKMLMGFGSDSVYMNSWRKFVLWNCLIKVMAGAIPGTSQIFSLQWRHNEHNGISNHQPRYCLLKCLFRHKSKETSKLHVTEGNSLVNSPHKGPVMQKMFPFDDIIMWKMLFVLMRKHRSLPLNFEPHICHCNQQLAHYSDVIMSVMTSQTTNLWIVYSTLYYSGRALHHWPLRGEFTGDR